MRGLSVNECATRAGVEATLWVVWERGEDWPTDGQIRRALGVGRETIMRLGAAAPDASS